MHKSTNNLHKNKKKGLSFLGFVLCLMLCSCFFNLSAYAETSNEETEILNYQNEETGFEVLLDDSADLLSDSEEDMLLEDMKPITEYGNVIFVSIDQNSTSTDSFAQSYYQYEFGYESGSLFIIDMDNRQIYIHNQDKISKTITKGISLTITDNVYAYATREDYYTCASVAFSQVQNKLDGKNIPQPMKYTCNGLLALLLALLLNYVFVKIASRARKAKDEELLSNLPMHCFITNERIQFTHQTKEYSPQSSGSSGGGGGGGGGGSSSSGGGHSF